jgi:hypothetical protein
MEAKYFMVVESAESVPKSKQKVVAHNRSPIAMLVPAELSTRALNKIPTSQRQVYDLVKATVDETGKPVMSRVLTKLVMNNLNISEAAARNRIYHLFHGGNIIEDKPEKEVKL